MFKHTPGRWVVPVANVFRVLAVDEKGEATRLIHEVPEDSWFGSTLLEWGEEDGPEAAANARLIAASPDLLKACIAALKENQFSSHGYIKQLVVAIERATGLTWEQLVSIGVLS